MINKIKPIIQLLWNEEKYGAHYYSFAMYGQESKVS